MKWTIKKKFFISYFLLFFIAGIVFHLIISNTIEKDTLMEIERDLEKIQYATMEYLRQLQMDAANNILLTNTWEVAYKLSEIHHQSVALFDANGSFLYEAIPIDSTLLMSQTKYNENLPIENINQLNLAYDNQSSYLLSKLEQGTVIYFTFPVYINGEFLGVIRYTGDYSPVFDRNENLVNSFSFLTMLLLLGVFLISLILTNQITRPIRQLKVVADQITKGNYQVTIEKNHKMRSET